MPPSVLLTSINDAEAPLTSLHRFVNFLLKLRVDIGKCHKILD